MLFMKKRFFAAIRSGRKTTTLRFWSRPQVRPGSVHRVRGLGRVRVTAVERVDEHRLTPQCARADGFRTLAQLRQALAEMYPPEAREGKRLYLVSFEYVDDGPNANPNVV
ncbi:MAG: hypothetical protein BWX88_02821 [Planctomycetes bacterium ADurb.Bin126]|nr:MAG: hypothetical protein BWX88_02821 [Planctomycetes bacterium ADurb.Bin126]